MSLYFCLQHNPHSPTTAISKLLYIPLTSTHLKPLPSAYDFPVNNSNKIDEIGKEQPHLPDINQTIFLYLNTLYLSLLFEWKVITLKQLSPHALEVPSSSYFSKNFFEIINIKVK